jgi:hypothetical protein
MAIRLLATYEFIDKDGHPAGFVRLPVIGYAPAGEDGRERPRVLLISGDDPHLVDFHPDSTIETQYGNLEALLIDAVMDPIPAQRSARGVIRGCVRCTKAGLGSGLNCRRKARTTIEG